MLEVDSSERDTVNYPNPNDYTVTLNTPIYKVSNIKLVSARIPTPMLLINDANRQFQVDNNVIILPNGNYSSGTDLASNLAIALAYPKSNISSVVYSSNTNTFTFSNSLNSPVFGRFSMKFYSGSNGYTSSTSSNIGTPASIMGFGAVDTPFQSNIVSGAIDLSGPSNLILRITNNDNDDFEKTLYAATNQFKFGSNVFNQSLPPILDAFYLGRILAFCNKDGIIELRGANDPVEYYFHRGPANIVKKLRFRWYWNNFNKLVPYDFMNQNHILKFKLTAYTDKFSLRDKDDVDDLFKLPPPLDIPSLDPPKRFPTFYIYIIIGVIVLIGLVMIQLTGRISGKK